jgi:hypothetical protein
VQTMPPPAGGASKDKLKSAKAPPSKAEKSISMVQVEFSSDDDDEEMETNTRVANVPTGRKATINDVKRSVKDLFPRLTGK